MKLSKLFWVVVMGVALLIGASQTAAARKKGSVRAVDRKHTSIPIMKETKSCRYYSLMWRCYVKRQPKGEKGVYKYVVAQIKLWRSIYKQAKKTKAAKKTLDKNCKAAYAIQVAMWRHYALVKYCQYIVTKKWPKRIPEAARRTITESESSL